MKSLIGQKNKKPILFTRSLKRFFFWGGRRCLKGVEPNRTPLLYLLSKKAPNFAFDPGSITQASNVKFAAPCRLPLQILFLIYEALVGALSKICILQNWKLAVFHDILHVLIFLHQVNNRFYFFMWVRKVVFRVITPKFLPKKNLC